MAHVEGGTHLGISLVLGLDQFVLCWFLALRCLSGQYLVFIVCETGEERNLPREVPFWYREVLQEKSGGTCVLLPPAAPAPHADVSQPGRSHFAALTKTVPNAWTSPGAHGSLPFHRGGSPCCFAGTWDLRDNDGAETLACGSSTSGKVPMACLKGPWTFVLSSSYPRLQEWVLELGLSVELK